MNNKMIVNDESQNDLMLMTIMSSLFVEQYIGAARQGNSGVGLVIAVYHGLIGVGHVVVETIGIDHL